MVGAEELRSSSSKLSAPCIIFMLPSQVRWFSHSSFVLRLVTETLLMRIILINLSLIFYLNVFNILLKLLIKPELIKHSGMLRN